MRKWIVLLLIILALFIGSFYLFIPNKISIKEKTTISFSAKAFSKALFNEATWQQWWPAQNGEKLVSLTRFQYNGNTYSLLERKLSSLLLAISNGKDSLQTELIVIPVKRDSIEVEWLGTATTSFHPIQRFQKNQWAQSIQKDLNTLLQKIQNFYTNPGHLYRIPIQEIKVVDSALIYTLATHKSYPSTEAVYSMIDKLKIFAKKNGAKQTGLPMLNIMPKPDSTYTTRVALPVDKKLKDEGDIQYRWMLGGGFILVSEVRGGPHRIQQAFAIMEAYIDDFNRIAPAIPFQSLVTDRRSEPDTNKWITKVYWPVM